MQREKKQEIGESGIKKSGTLLKCVRKCTGYKAAHLDDFTQGKKQSCTRSYITPKGKEKRQKLEFGSNL